MPERISQPRNTSSPAVFTGIGRIEYTRALRLQQQILAQKLENPDLPDRILFVEHDPVYTLGRRGGRENLVVSESYLSGKGIDIVQTDRGGNITYHGPGQAVLYPIVDLKRSGLSVPDFVYGLEEIMKLTCKALGVLADRDERNHGLWVKNAKIGSVGISIKKGISIHGLALNINPDLTPFSWINPCGLANQAMTSVARQTALESKSPLTEQHLDKNPDQKDKDLMIRVEELFMTNFARCFNRPVKEEKKNDLQLSA